MHKDFNYRDKIPVAVLGATGNVGQKFVELLASHPWFELTAVAASDKSVGRPYREAVNWIMSTPLPKEIGDLQVQACKPGLPAQLIFSALDSSVAGEIEIQFAQAGNVVLSNASNHRQDADVPLLVPEVNSDHLQLLDQIKKEHKGCIVTNPNCVVVALVMALKPLVQNFGVEAMRVVTMQAVSGAGYPGVPSLDILDNVIPYIANEEEKVATEPLKILGNVEQQQIKPYSMKISAQCNRVPVTDGHMASLSIKLKGKTSLNEIKEMWRDFEGEPQLLDLPSAPKYPLVYFDEERYPQPKMHRQLGKGMSVALGRLKECPVLDYQFVLLSHNTIRGAAGSAILNAELMVKRGFIFW